MDADRAIARLEGYQRQITTVLAGAHPIINDPDASQFRAMALGRWQLMRVLREYQLFKHTVIFDPIIARDNSLQANAAGLLKKRCTEMGDAFNVHVRRWSFQGPSSAWPTYSTEARALCSRIKGHLAQELLDVRALLTEA